MPLTISGYPFILQKLTAQNLDNRLSYLVSRLLQFRYGKCKEFVQATIDLGHAIADRQLHLVYRGGDRRLSKLFYETAFVRGSQVLGIIPKALKLLGCPPNPSTRKELVVSSMQERISEMLNHSDAFIFLPGDLATLEALITFAYWAGPFEYP
ncbi:hypothetical protein WN944_014421 [Citrus x changshan-huyou]|uniref:cytokinin riboside 5'-monophosphate phosphoribohydrolase n=1 Tax=Citrus x changshan-huyou TaxID=2935761 RepID=A0AAP0QIP9_9ROSI